MLKRTARPTFSPPARATRASIPVFAAMVRPGAGRAGDAHEREADRAAESVARGAMPAVAPIRPAGLGREAAASAGPSAKPEAVGRLGVGQPLDSTTRAFFETRFGHNFADVRVHADNGADAAARSVGARAFTSGSNVAFGAGQYAPHSGAGRRLLAHELTHVVQQTHGEVPAGTIQRDPKKKTAATEDWDFTPADYAALKTAGKDLTISADSNWMPKKLQENLLKTLAYILDPKRKPLGTEGVNVKDFFHGHVVIPKDPGISAEAQDKRTKFEEKMEKETTKALGGEFKPVTKQNIGAYTKAIESSLPLFGAALEEGIKAKGAVAIYHTFEYKSPSDLEAKGKSLDPGDPRRNYMTPLDTNTPAPYTPPEKTNASSYTRDYYMYLQFAFLVDNSGAVHVRPSSTTELSSVTGTPIK